MAQNQLIDIGSLAKELKRELITDIQTTVEKNYWKIYDTYKTWPCQNKKLLSKTRAGGVWCFV